MAITYTESWAQSFSEDSDNREVTVEYHVSSDGDPVTAFNYKTATHATTGAPFPAKGQQRSEDTRYRLHRFSAPQNEGPRYAIVSTVWKVGPFGGDQTEDDPLNTPTRYRWRPVTETAPTDQAYDAGGKFIPLLNSAGDPFSGTVTGFTNSYIIEATRNEASFDQAFAVSFQNKLNQAAFQIAGTTLQAGEALCTGIFPPSDYTLDTEVTPYVPVTYQFTVRERLTLTGGGRVTAFCHRILDQGRRGWIEAGALTRVPIYDTNGGDVQNPTPVSTDVPLDKGVPIGEPGDGGKRYYSVHTDFNPDDGKGWAVNNQVAVPPLLAQDKTTSGVTFLYYRKHISTDFSGLNL
jgi:hypothetical protein